MFTQIAGLFPITRRHGSRSGPIEHATPTSPPVNPTSWGALTLQVFAHAAALGLMFPPSAFYTARERQPHR
jgi:hypothetical protein